jgi:hypothetical protein
MMLIPVIVNSTAITNPSVRNRKIGLAPLRPWITVDQNATSASR